MKTLYLECSMGAAGDMLMSALSELIPNPDEFIEKLNNIGIPDVKIERKIITKCGIKGTGIDVLIHGHSEEHIHEHHGENSHEHHREHSHEHHHHTGMKEITDIVQKLNVSDKVRQDIMAVYNLIAEAESCAHGCKVEHIHFHEVGSMDAIADIAGVCMLIEEIQPDKIAVSHIHVGSGQVKCAHGILPVPAPATAHILQGVPTYGGKVSGELCTPTGAALLKHFADEFTDEYHITADKIGYGIGKRSFYDKDGAEILSSVRAAIGEDNMTDKIIMLSCNIDDMTGEQVGYAFEKLFETGALDVYTTPICMKKNRTGILLSVLCSEKGKNDVIKQIFKYTTTIGIRETAVNRHILDRREEIAHTKYGDVRVKKSSGFGVSKRKIEYDDLKEIADKNNISISDIQLD